MTDTFPRQHARTRRFTLGAPRTFRVASDGSRVSFLRSRGGDDAANCLWMLDVASQDLSLVVDPRELQEGEADATVPSAERVRRERARETGDGIVAYDGDTDLATIVFALAGRLFALGLGGEARELTSEVAFDPRLSPDGTLVSYVSGAALRLVSVDGSGDRELVGSDSPTVTWGSAEFVAAEEMGRARGHWWAPTSDRLLVCRVDTSIVSEWWISGPADPSAPPTAIRYPAAGTTNAAVDLTILGVDGHRTPVDWQRDEFEYLADVAWTAHGATAVVQTRDQRTLAVLTIDPATGDTDEIHRQTDEHWVELVPGAPAWSDNHLVTVEDRDDTRRLVVDGTPVTPTGLQVLSVPLVEPDHALVVATTEPTEAHLFRVRWDGTVTDLTHGPAVHGAVARGGVTVETRSDLDQPGTRVRVLADDDEVAAIESLAETPLVRPVPQMHSVGDRELRTALLLPTDADPDTPLPVLLDPYGGPHAQRVRHAAALFSVSQWFADQGFAVIVTDGRGSPARGPDWERAVRGDLAGPVLDDQIDALHALGDLEPRLDLDRVGIRGWSFGGYLAALAVLRRPDVFHAAIAGAPVTDWRLYDTHYTERYLGHPDTEPANYERTDLTAEADALDRPLLLVHGLADDNVVVAHTLTLSRALLEAGRPHQFLPLSGVTHMTPQEVVAENLLRLQAAFLHEHLG